jgi:hypothetical protein
VSPTRLSRVAPFAIIPGCVAVLTLGAVALLPDAAPAQEPQRPAIETNTDYVEAATRRTSLDVNDTMAVFDLVFGSLPARVKVYPTENYFYFRFTHNGVRYAGDMRFDVADRDQGKLHFGYVEEPAPWKQADDGADTDGILDASKGVLVERLDWLVYRVTYRENSVIFELNDLSRVKPPAGMLGPDEQFVGPVFDESAVRFFFVYDARLKIFHFILDETVAVPDVLTPIKQTPRILIGKRTGFAFYRDQKLDRKILIGVYRLNSLANTYLDGPFDQLPENFVEGDILQRLFVDSDPGAKDKLDRLGHYLDGTGRFLVHPYLVYGKDGDLAVVDRCATSKRVAPRFYYACFAFDPDQVGRSDAQPLALTRRFTSTRK